MIEFVSLFQLKEIPALKKFAYDVVILLDDLCITGNLAR